MNKADTIQMFALVAALFPRDESFKAATTQMVSVWAEMLSDLDFSEVKTALKVHSSRCAFPPSIADIRAAVEDMHKAPDDMTADEAWGLVMNAIRRSTLFSVREFNALPEICQRLVGSPAQLKEWAVSESFNSSVEKALFSKSFNQRKTQDAELKKLPANVRALITGAMPKGISAHVGA